MKCSFSGCGNEAAFLLTQRAGKKQQTYCCKKHAPRWVKTGTPSLFAQKTGAEAHSVERLQCAS